MTYLEAKNEAEEWFRMARDEEKTAIKAYETIRPEPLNVVCTLCQQATEKRLKALLIVHGSDFPQKHDLLQLAGLLYLNDVTFSKEERDALKRISDFGPATRYPHGKIITREMTVQALEDTEMMRGVLTAKVRTKLQQLRYGENLKKKNPDLPFDGNPDNGLSR